jgi:polysaccharide export outer membrane protein
LVPISEADKPDAQLAGVNSDAQPDQNQSPHSPGDGRSLAAADTPAIRLFPAPQTGRSDEGVQTSGLGLLPDYVLGPGDELAIRDMSSIEASTLPPLPNQRVLNDGTVIVPPVGVLCVAGLTLSQANELVNEKARRFIVSPGIYIAVSNPRPTSVYVLGEVVNPGLYSSAGSVSTPEGGAAGSNAAGSPGLLTVSAALQRAGGLTEYANVRQIQVTRLSSKKPLVCDAWKLLTEGDASQDPLLLAGDVVYVPKGGDGYNPKPFGLVADQHRPVRVWGAVNKPGLYEAKAGDDILSVISEAGGFQKHANTKAVMLSRLNRDGTVTTEKVNIPDALTDADAAARVHVSPGDVVVVNWSLKKESGSKAGVGLVTFVVFALIYALNYRFNRGLNQQNFGFNQQLQQSGARVAPVSGGAGGNAVLP